MKRLTKLTALFLCAGLAFSSCKTEGCTDPTSTNYNPDAKKDDGSCTYAPTIVPMGINSDPTYTFDLDGVTHAHPGGYDVLGVTGSSDSRGPDSTTSVWGTGFYDHDLEYSILEIDKGVHHYQTGGLSDQDLLDYLAKGFYPYALNDDQGIRIQIGTLDGHYYRSNLGAQSNGTFEIVDVLGETNFNGFYVKVFVKFSGVVYNVDDLNDMKTITNGEFVGHFGPL